MLIREPLPVRNKLKKTSRKPQQVELPNQKHQLLGALKEISTHAHRARQYTLLDREIDQFTVSTLCQAVSGMPLGRDQLQQVLDTAEEMVRRSQNLYNWACDLFSRKPDSSDAKVTGTPDNGCREKRYWEGVCAQKLTKLATLIDTGEEDDLKYFDICGVVHGVLSRLAEDLTVFELIDLAVHLDKDPVDLLAERGKEVPSGGLTPLERSADAVIAISAENY